MLFNSYIFVFLFFPICIFGYYLLAPKSQGIYAKLWLILLSFWFYGYFNPSYLWIMLGSIVVNYLFHNVLLVQKKKYWIVLAIAANLGVLFYFKYYDFFLSNLNVLFQKDFALKHVVLPLGISFFTFQQIGFVVDTYRGEIGEVSPIDYCLFVTFFPQLIAGPIVNHNEMLPQFAGIKDKQFESETFFRGFTLFVLGLTKKVLIADTLGAAVDHGYMYLADQQAMDCILIMLWYALQLYFDFSGYCDMARGIGKMLQIEIPVNFHSPYKAVDIVDFWKRWHITLSRFFTKYIYIPLGGNREGAWKMYCNFIIVYFLSGLWHGAGWNFIFWGMMHGVLYVITRALMRKKKEGATSNLTESTHGQAELAKKQELSTGIKRTRSVVKRALMTIATFLYVSVAWVYFRAESIGQANELLKKIVTGKWQKINFQLAGCIKPDEFWYVLKVLHLDNNLFSQYILMTFITVGCLLTVFFAPNAAEVSERMKPKAANAIIMAVLFVWCILSFSGVSTFLYFNF